MYSAVEDHFFVTEIQSKSTASLVAQTVKNLPAVWETRVRSLGQEDPLEEKMATHSSILVWRIPWTEEPGGLPSMGSQRVRRDWHDLACSLCLMSTFGVQAEMYKIFIFKPVLLKMCTSFFFLLFPYMRNLFGKLFEKQNSYEQSDWVAHLLLFTLKFVH